MHTMTITTKRQATLPAALCRDLGLEPGHKVEIEKRVIKGEVIWLLRGRKPIDWSWFGAARRYATGKSHRWSDIQRSIADGWGRDRP